MSLIDATIFLTAAVVMVPLFKKFKLGAILGYLAAGALIGPSVFGLIEDVDHILHMSEFGVVLLLFLIGLELEPKRLWSLRRSVFGVGGVQVLVTSVVLAAAGALFGLSLSTAVVAGMGLSLSSTAFALQLLAERRQLTTAHGRLSFSILLFQDIMVAPMLAIIPLLGIADSGVASGPGWLSALEVIGVLAGVIIGGRFLLRPVMRAVAATRVHEVFTAMALLLVIGVSLLMDSIGLSMALGAFLAGVLLADSEYRHALEADIEPFKGLLLGLFFISVGMSLDVQKALDQPGAVFGALVGLLAIKFAILYFLGRAANLSGESSRCMAFVLPQGGEFAFVLFSAAVAAQAMEKPLADLLILAVTLSMVATPFLTMFNDSVLRRWLRSEDQRDFDHIDDSDNKVIIAGFGRFGQIIARILSARKIGFTALESSSGQVDFVRRFGNKVFYGDAKRLETLRAAGADKAEIFVLAIDDVAQSTHIAEIAKQNFPNLKIFARARNRQHAYRLMEIGVHYQIRDTYVSSLEAAEEVLESLGLGYSEAKRTVEMFREHDERILQETYKFAEDEHKQAHLAKQFAKELEEVFQSDASGKDIVG